MIKFDYNEIQERLCEELNMLGEREPEGIILYGSRAHNLERKDSDFDFFLIAKEDSNKKNSRGKLILDNIHFIDTFERKNGICKIEVNYNIQTENHIRNELDIASKSNEYYLYSAICLGHLLSVSDYDYEGKIDLLRKEIIDKFAENAENKLSEDKILNERLNIENAINRIKSYELFGQDSLDEVNFLYYNLIEKIRNFYCKCNGYPSIQTCRVKRVYQNEEYRKSIFGNIKVADDRFIELFLRCINTNRTEEEIIDDLSSKYSKDAITKKLLQSFYSNDSINEFEDECEELLKPKTLKDKIKCMDDLWKFVTKDMVKLDENHTEYQYGKSIFMSSGY